MNSLVRWIATAVCTLALAFSASAQGNRALPGAKGAFAPGTIKHSDRTVIRDDIVHYCYDVVVGPGKFDVIRLHRVVKERQPYHPIRTVDGVMLLPGLPTYFEGSFMGPLISQVPTWDRSIVVFLAKNNLDVWGMDYGWALVPAQTTDFNFMKGWGVEKDTRHAEIALSLARRIRTITDQGFGRLHLLGYSYGAVIAYSVAGEETQWPRFLRNVKGIIPVDWALKFEEKSIRDYYCSMVAIDQANLDAGVYNDDSGLFLRQLSDLALSAPDEESPFLPPLANYQVALVLGASTWLLNGQFWHFVGGYLDANGIPTDLRYTEAPLWLDWLHAVAPRGTMQTWFDIDAVLCGDVEVRFDDHLREIAVPILYVGAGGGVGEFGYYTTSLTASKDVTKIKVTLELDRTVDFGHVDLFTATNAETLVWRPILDWLKAHR
jgi:pimeloyl-ACP methyl ester carboxylesterase